MEELLIGISVALIEITLEAKSRRTAERRLRGPKRVPDHQFKLNAHEKEHFSEEKIPYTDIEENTKETMPENVSHEVKENEGTMPENVSHEVKEKEGTMPENVSHEVKENEGTMPENVSHEVKENDVTQLTREDIKSCEREDRQEATDSSAVTVSSNIDSDRDMEISMSSQHTQTEEDLIEPEAVTDAKINKNHTEDLINKSAEAALDVYKELRTRVLSVQNRKMLREATEMTEEVQKAPITDEDHCACVTQDEDYCACMTRNEDHCACVTRDEDYCASVTRDEDHCACVTRDEDHCACVTNEDQSALVVFYSFH